MNTPSLQQLLEAGVHFGHQVRRGNPRMRPYIYGARDGVHIIDLTLSEKLLKEACDFVYNLGKSGGRLLFVGTKKQAQPIVDELAEKAGAFYMSSRWMGGFLTNFEEIQKNIKKLKNLKEAKEKGELSKYTKKEQLLIDRKITKLEKDFKGVMDLVSIPEGIFIIDAVVEDTALREANKKGVKVVAIADSNSDPTLMDYPIPGNDDAIKSITILAKAVADSYEQGRKEAGKLAERIRQKEEKKALRQAQGKQAETVDQQLKEQAAVAEEQIEKEVIKESSKVVE